MSILEPGFHPLEETLFSRLESRGVPSKLIPGFLKDLSNGLCINPDMVVLQANELLNVLGWDVTLDYRTFELIRACLGSQR